MRNVFGLLIAALVGTPAAAQTTARLAVADVVADAVRSHPEIKAAERRYQAALQRPVQARSLPDPMISAGYRSSGSPRPGAGLGSEPTANIGFMVSQPIPFPGKLDVRGAVAAREAEGELQLVEAARLSVTSRVKQAYYRLASSHAKADVLARNKSLLDILLKVSETRYSVGHAAQQDVFKAQTQLSILELQQVRNDAERDAREGELNALLARATAAAVARPDDLVFVELDRSLDSLVDAAAQAPMLRRDHLMIDRALMTVEAAKKDFKPDFSISGGYAYMGAMPAMYEFRIDINVPLQRERRAAALAEQVEGVAAARTTYDSTRLSLQSRLQEDYTTAATSSRLARLYRDTVIVQTRLAFESSAVSYRTGGVDFLTVLTNLGSLVESEMTYIEELTTVHLAIARLEEMTGLALLN
jgi:cobalt-zinc-cadmium efflux system outer membrane protein